MTLPLPLMSASHYLRITSRTATSSKISAATLPGPSVIPMVPHTPRMALSGTRCRTAMQLAFSAALSPTTGTVTTHMRASSWIRPSALARARNTRYLGISEPRTTRTAMHLPLPAETCSHKLVDSRARITETTRSHSQRLTTPRWLPLRPWRFSMARARSSLITFL